MSVSGTAQSLDISTHNSLISKLESSVTDIGDKTTQSKIYLRLANLYADKSRLLDLDKQPIKARKSRQKAISYYLAVSQPSKTGDEAHILLQLSHLYTLLNQSHKSEKIFKNIIKDRKNRNKKLVGEAYAKLGEIQFQRSQYKAAGDNFKKALYYPISKVIDVIQRLAWCEFNQGKFKVSEKTHYKCIES